MGGLADEIDPCADDFAQALLDRVQLEHPDAGRSIEADGKIDVGIRSSLAPRRRAKKRQARNTETAKFLLVSPQARDRRLCLHYPFLTTLSGKSLPNTRW